MNYLQNALAQEWKNPQLGNRTGLSVNGKLPTISASFAQEMKSFASVFILFCTSETFNTSPLPPMIK